MMWVPFARPDRLAAGLRACAGTLRRRVAGPWLRELVLIGALYGIYEVSRGLGDVDVSTALRNGREILHLERIWHIDPERVLNHALHHMTVLAVAASYFYSLMHYLVTPAVLIWLYRRHRGSYGRARTALAISTGLGLVGYLLLPTAPPRMLEHTGLRDILADTQSYGWWGNDGSVPRGLGGLTNQFAAMPSLHVGWAVWCGAVIAIYARHRWAKLLGIAYPIATSLVVMATGNHYLLDAVAGVLVMGIGALLSGAVPERFRGVPMGPENTVIDGVSAAELEEARARAGRPRPSRWDAPEAEQIGDEPAGADRYCHARR
ncbi:MAG TPA: phosphatase PAP2 family protein [Jatrophihabitans sp.]|jgi:hypothetical protein|nr:phosphatase PAP2 family protein [Jatrophihabitans sp.]